jgi:hypothetical protein
MSELLDKTRDQRLVEASQLGRRIYYFFVAVIFTWILSVWLCGTWWR